jgi:hypothetical protein
MFIGAVFFYTVPDPVSRPWWSYAKIATVEHCRSITHPYPSLIIREGTRSAIIFMLLLLKYDDASAPSLIIREGRVSYMASPQHGHRHADRKDPEFPRKA